MLVQIYRLSGFIAYKLEISPIDYFDIRRELPVAGKVRYSVHDNFLGYFNYWSFDFTFVHLLKIVHIPNL